MCGTAETYARTGEGADRAPSTCSISFSRTRTEDSARCSSGLIPSLGDDEVLLEFAFTLGENRPQGVMPYAAAELVREARRRGARRLVTFVPSRNTTVLRFFQRINFEPFSGGREHYRLFHRRIEHSTTDRSSAARTVP
jgi:hypothetical protein